MENFVLKLTKIPDYGKDLYVGIKYDHSPSQTGKESFFFYAVNDKRRAFIMEPEDLMSDSEYYPVLQKYLESEGFGYEKVTI